MDTTSLRNCPFCNGRQFRLDESNMWTGMRNQLISITLRHWCEFKPLTSSVNMVGQSKEEVFKQWNGHLDVLEPSSQAS